MINEKKRLVGMLSLGDISHATSHELSGEVVAAVSAHHAGTVFRLPAPPGYAVPRGTREHADSQPLHQAVTGFNDHGNSWVVTNGWQSGDGRVEAFGQGGRLPNTKNAAGTPSY